VWRLRSGDWSDFCFLMMSARVAYHVTAIEGHLDGVISAAAAIRAVASIASHFLRSSSHQRLARRSLKARDRHHGSRSIFCADALGVGLGLWLREGGAGSCMRMLFVTTALKASR
jgi:hypothetical protein